MSYRWIANGIEITARPSSLEEMEKITADLWRTLLVDWELGIPDPKVMIEFIWTQAYWN